jgi:serine protease Do
VALGDSEHLRVGDWVMAIGNPFGLGGSVTLGIVSALNRDIHAGNYDDFIQTDAAINRGNSGGPLFNLKGDVVGMNTAIISPSGESVGIGFATPASTIRSIVQQIVTHGEIRRGWIGVRIQTVTPEIAASLGLPDRHGALVAGVSEDGPAAEAGLETGDLITTFDGQPVPEMRDLPRIVAETEIGKRVTVGIIRSGRPRQVKLTVGRLDEPDEDESATDTSPPASAKVSVLGLDLAALSDDVRAQFGIADGVTGALVADLSPSSEAADKGVRPGDIIVRVGQADVTSPEDVRDEVAKEKKAGRKLVLLRILTGGAARFVAVPLE